MAELLVSTSPADSDAEIGRFPVADGAAVDAAVARARAAFPAWRDSGLEARRRVLLRFRDLAGFVENISREHTVVVYGDHIEELQVLASELGMTCKVF